MAKEATEHDFISLSEVNTFTLWKTEDKKNTILEYTMVCNPVSNVIKRKEWNLIDLFGVLGGIASTLGVIFTVILNPFADH